MQSLLYATIDHLLRSSDFWICRAAHVSNPCSDRSRARFHLNRDFWLVRLFHLSDHLEAHELSRPRSDGDPDRRWKCGSEAKTGKWGVNRPPHVTASTGGQHASMDGASRSHRGRILLGLWEKPIFKIWIILKVSTELCYNTVPTMIWSLGSWAGMEPTASPQPRKGEVLTPEGNHRAREIFTAFNLHG